MPCSPSADNDSSGSDCEPHVSAGLRLGHLECPSGIAGDMFLGACLDAGGSFELLETTVRELGLEGVSLEVRSARRGGLTGKRFRVLRNGVPVEGPDPDEEAAGGATARAQTQPSEGTQGRHTHAHSSEHTHDHGHEHRSWIDIKELLETSALDRDVRELSLQMFSDLAEVEAEAHGVDPEAVHFHEVGALDSIVDIVGSCALFLSLGIDRLSCGTVVVGSGTVATAHGRLPVPAPATARLLVGVPTRGGGAGELVTPTGALILKHLVRDFGPQPDFVTETLGYGLGKRELEDRPNAVRLTIGSVDQRREDQAGLVAGRVTVIETQVDDVSGEQLGWVVESLLESGALDVFISPVMMKKGRPGQLVTVIARPEMSRVLAERLLLESGSLGCRVRETERIEVRREVHDVETPFGTVGVKLARHDGQVSVAPEYEDCRRCAQAHGRRWREVYDAALTAWRSTL